MPSVDIPPYEDGLLRFVRALPLTYGAPADWYAKFGKQNVCVTVPPYIVHVEGDGPHKDDTPPYPNYAPVTGIYNGLRVWNTREELPRMKQVIDHYGKRFTGEINNPYRCWTEGSGVGFIEATQEVIIMPGYVRGYHAPSDIHGNRANSDRRVSFENIHTGECRLGRVVGPAFMREEWGGDHWNRNAFPGDLGLFVIQSGLVGNRGGLAFYDPAKDLAGAPDDEVYTYYAFTDSDLADVPWAPIVGNNLSTNAWYQRIWKMGDELVCWCGWRGLLLGVHLPTKAVRIIADLGAQKDVEWPGDGVEGVSTQERFLGIDQEKGQFAVATQGAYQFADPARAFDIALGNLTTGNFVTTRYPRGGQQFSSGALMGGRLFLCDSNNDPDGYYWWIFEQLGNP